MLLKLLKAFGLDVPGRIAELRNRVERRVEQAADEAKEVVRTAVLTAVLAGVAAALAAAALGIGLVALYRWAADSFGPFVGYGIVAGVLLFMSAVLGIVVVVRLRQPGADRPDSRAANAAADFRSSATASASGQTGGAASDQASAAAAAPAAAAGWAELLAFLLPLLMKSPVAGGSLADELAAAVRLGVSGKTRRALKGATAMVREGDRANLLAAVAGAALLGWMISRPWRQKR